MRPVISQSNTILESKAKHSVCFASAHGRSGERQGDQAPGHFLACQEKRKTFTEPGSQELFFKTRQNSHFSWLFLQFQPRVKLSFFSLIFTSARKNNSRKVVTLERSRPENKQASARFVERNSDSATK